MIRRVTSLFSRLERTICANRMVKFLFFKEDDPKHSVAQDLNPLFLSALSMLCFAAGFVGLLICARFTIIGFLIYYVVLAIGLLEVLHFVYDR